GQIHPPRLYSLYFVRLRSEGGTPLPAHWGRGAGRFFGRGMGRPPGAPNPAHSPQEGAAFGGSGWPQGGGGLFKPPVGPSALPPFSGHLLLFPSGALPNPRVWSGRAA